MVLTSSERKFNQKNKGEITIVFSIDFVAAASNSSEVIVMVLLYRSGNYLA